MTIGKAILCNKDISLLSTVFFVFAFLAIAVWVTEYFNVSQYKKLVASCFFIYAFHFVDLPGGSPLMMLKRALSLLDNYIPSCILYLVTPMFTIAVCYVIYRVLDKYAHRYFKYFTGLK